jgi:beta-lactamase regulating signal transducer with metallopeptidase domain
MTLWLLVESALRSLALGIVVWVGLKALRVRSPQVELTAWTIVLAAALAMPMLMQVVTVTVPTRLPVSASVMEILSASPTAPSDASSLPALLPAPSAVALPPTPMSTPVNWPAFAAGLYLTVAVVLALRMSIGVAMTWRLLRAAQPVRETWTDGSDVRTCNISMPVTFGKTILLPADYTQWSAIKRQAVLAHECSHVSRGDYWVLLLAALHRALFWFNPLSWWLLNRLAAFMEAASDDAAIADLHDRTSYAEILVELAGRAIAAPAGVAMARPATVARRVERILREKTLPVKMGWGPQALMFAGLAPIAAIAASTVAQSEPAEQLADQPARNTARSTGDAAGYVQGAGNRSLKASYAGSGSGHDFGWCTIATIPAHGAGSRWSGFFQRWGIEACERGPAYRPDRDLGYLCVRWLLRWTA